jgi:hypothetical protein
MRIFILILFSFCLLCNAQTKKFVVVGGTASNKISLIGTGDSTQVTVPRVWLAYELRYSQRDSFPSVSIGTYRTYQQFLNSQPIATDLNTSSYEYRGVSTLGDSILVDMRRYFNGLGFNAGIVIK